MTTRLKDSLKKYLDNIGDVGDIDPEIIINTPNRFLDSLELQLSGYKVNIDNIIKNAIYNCDNNDIIVVKNIEFDSMCAHHLLSFGGIISIGYKPKDKIIGLSKIPLIIDTFSKRLQSGENLTKNICDYLNSLLACEVYVYSNISHKCAMCKEIKSNHETKTHIVSKTTNMTTDDVNYFISKLHNIIKTDAISIHIEDDSLKFNSGHFTIFDSESSNMDNKICRENIHGHTYYISLDISGHATTNGVLANYSEIKIYLREIVKMFDEKFLLQMQNKYLRVSNDDTNTIIQFGDTKISIPSKEILHLPIVNTTKEDIAEYILNSISIKLHGYQNIETLKLGVKSANNTWCYVKHRMQI